MAVFLKAPILVLHYVPDDVICNIAIFVNDTILFLYWDLWQQL